MQNSVGQISMERKQSPTDRGEITYTLELSFAGFVSQKFSPLSLILAIAVKLKTSRCNPAEEQREPSACQQGYIKAVDDITQLHFFSISFQNNNLYRELDHRLQAH